MKKKYIALITAVLLIVSLIPLGSFALTSNAKTEITPATVIEDINKAVGASGDKELLYTDIQEKSIKTARDHYDQLSQLGQNQVTNFNRLCAGEALFAKYENKIKALEEIIKKIGDYVNMESIGEGGAYKLAGEALQKDEYTKFTPEPVKVTLDGGGEFYMTGKEVDITGKIAQLVKDIWDNSTLAVPVVQAIANIPLIDESDYKDSAKAKAITHAKDLYKSLKTQAKEMVGNYGRLAGQVSKIKNYTQAVANVTDLLNKNTFTKVIGTANGQVDVDKARESYSQAKIAFDKLSITLRKDVTWPTYPTSFSQRLTEINKAQNEADGKAAAAALDKQIEVYSDLQAVKITDEENLTKIKASYDKLADYGTEGTKLDRYNATVDVKNFKILQDALAKVTQLINDLSDGDRTKRVYSLIEKLPAKAEDVTRDNTPQAEAVLDEYSRSKTQEQITWDPDKNDFTAKGTAASWQNIVKADLRWNETLKEVLSKISDLTKQDKAFALKYRDDYLTKLDPYIDNAPLTAANIEAARTLLDSANKAYTNGKKYEKLEIEKLKNYSKLDTLNTKVAVYDENDKDKKTADSIALLMGNLPSTGKITQETLSKYKPQIEEVQTAYEIANDNIKAYFLPSGIYANEKKAYDQVLAKFEAIEDKHKVASMIGLIKTLKVVEPLAAQAEIDDAAILISKANDQFLALTSSAKAQVTNAARLEQVNDSLKTAEINVVNNRIGNIGAIGTDLTDYQKQLFVQIRDLLTKYGLTFDKDNEEASDIKGVYRDKYKQTSDKLDTECLEDAQAMKDKIDKLPVGEVTKNNAGDFIGAKRIYDVMDPLAKSYFDLKYPQELKTLLAKYKQAYALSLKNAVVTPIKDYTYTGKEIIPQVEIKDSSGKVIDPKNYELKVKGNVNTGTVIVTMYSQPASIYYGDIQATFKIVPASVSKAKMYKISSQTYEGKAKVPRPKVILGTKTLKNGTDYTLSYKNNKAIGKATLTLKAKGNYTGTLSQSFNIIPSKGKIKSLKPGTGSFTVTMRKLSGGVKYQISYKTSLGKYKDLKTSATNKKITKLKKKTKYIVKIRAYKVVGKDTYYGPYTSAKSIITQ
ncbi:MAG: hypothetical protein RSB81_06940 [Anaerovoracaceae bacterium]